MGLKYLDAFENVEFVEEREDIINLYCLSIFGLILSGRKPCFFRFSFGTDRRVCWDPLFFAEEKAILFYESFVSFPFSIFYFYFESLILKVLAYIILLAYSIHRTSELRTILKNIPEYIFYRFFSHYSHSILLDIRRSSGVPFGLDT